MKGFSVLQGFPVITMQLLSCCIQAHLLFLGTLKNSLHKNIEHTVGYSCPREQCYFQLCLAKTFLSKECQEIKGFWLYCFVLFCFMGNFLLIILVAKYDP